MDHATERQLDEHLAALRDAKASATDPTLSALERRCAQQAAGEHEAAVIGLLRR